MEISDAKTHTTANTEMATNLMFIRIFPGSG
nr:MAG TPA_asm: hypothetical protein [Caudoviricetes sp.]DAV20664.1 MAG TPA: hypothetical protein [Bacteriophage sp.]DAV81313.1 MAG TPA: hypothetical protein [Caudoviricetes sp.]DAZ70364.1 MAG TPA: hypothetical protein [Caudoviricetes sp.]DAZ79903.1 MAG TPA: hypothetical protein [Caudoviricetes sp.]